MSKKLKKIFRDALTPEQRKRLEESMEFMQAREFEYRNMNNDNLIASAKYCMSQMQAPYKHPPGPPVYDSVFYHIIVPELLRRLGNASS